MFNFNDMPDSVGILERTVLNMFEDTYGIDDDIWEIAREYNSIPNFSNIYIDIIYSRIEYVLNEYFGALELDINYYVNNLVSTFYVNRSEIKNKKELLEVLIEAFEEKKDEISDKDIEQLDETFCKYFNIFLVDKVA